MMTHFILYNTYCTIRFHVNIYEDFYDTVVGFVARDTTCSLAHPFRIHKI